MHPIEFFQRGADDKRTVNVGRGHGSAHVIDALVQTLEREMAVGIDVHRSGRRSGEPRALCQAAACRFDLA
jgi:UDP-glucose 4-epimerase